MVPTALVIIEEPPIYKANVAEMEIRCGTEQMNWTVSPGEKAEWEGILERVGLFRVKPV